MLMVRVAMQLMAGHMLKAAALTRKFLKASQWLLKVRRPRRRPRPHQGESVDVLSTDSSGNTVLAVGEDGL